jgi:hypothetical protein
LGYLRVRVVRQWREYERTVLVERSFGMVHTGLGFARNRVGG